MLNLSHHRPIIRDTLVEPRVKEALEGPEAQEDAEAASRGEDGVEKVDEFGAREVAEG